MFPEFAGVALADILANSVAIVIIIIVVTLMVRHEQEQEKLEQAEDVSILLSRNLATSVVMNALPTSPPVRLHHYNTSPLDRNPHHSLMPILELHDHYVKDFYSGKRYPRNTLLLQDNPLDFYLKRLSPQQKIRIRMDVYGIRLFYIMMSILKSHNIRIGHWHFLGYPPNKTPGTEEDAGTAEQTLASKQEKPGENGGNTDQKNDSTAQSDNQNTDDLIDKANQAGIVPQQSELFFTRQGSGNYPYNDLALPNRGNKDNAEETLDLPGESQQTDPSQQQSDEIFNALAEMMEADLRNQGRPGNPSQIISHFRSANPNSKPTKQQQRQQALSMSQQQQNRSIDFYTLLPALFTFMEQVQADADKGRPSRLADYNFMRDVLGLLQRLPPLTDVNKIAFFHRLSEAIKHFPQEEKETLFLNRGTNIQIRGRLLALPINQRIQRSILIDDANQQNEYELPGDRNVVTRLSLYPEIYQGLSQPLAEDSIILMPPQQKDPTKFSWRVVTVVNPTVSDFITAFIYSAIDESGNQLLIDTETNAVKISDLNVTTYYPTLPLRQERWQLFLYSLVAIFFIFGILRRLKKTA